MIYSDVHILWVLRLGDEDEYEILHPAECRVRPGVSGRGFKPEHECSVQFEVDNCGIDFDLMGITTPGKYMIQAWMERWCNWEYGDEADGGLIVVDEE